MRILLLSILGSLGLAVLGWPTLPQGTVGAGPPAHARPHAIWVTPDGMHVNLMAVSDESGDDDNSSDVNDDSGAPDPDNPAPDQDSDRVRTFTPNSRIRTFHHHQTIDIDLSDLVIRPV